MPRADALPAALARALLAGAFAGNRWRLALCVTSISIGVALAVAVHAIHTSAVAEMTRAARTLAGGADLEVRGPRSGFDEALYPKVALIEGVALASPVLEVSAALPGTETALRVIGIDGFRAARLTPALLGRPQDDQASLASFFRGDAIFLNARALRLTGAAVGATLQLQSGVAPVTLAVAGTVGGGDGGALAVMDIAGAQDIFRRAGRLTRIDLRLASGADPEAVKARLRAVLPPGTELVAPLVLEERLAALSRAYRTNLTALALVALFTGAFLVFSTQALEVTRRAQEFATLRALGFTRRNLATLLIAEGALVGAAGALLGVVLGLAAARAMLFSWGADLGAGFFDEIESGLALDPWAIAGIAALGVATALAGAWWPTRQLGRLTTSDALRQRSIDLATPTGRGRWAPSAFLFALAALLSFLPAVDGLPLAGYAAIACGLGALVLAIPGITAWLLARAPESRGVPFMLALAQVRHLPGHLAASIAGVVVSVALSAAMVIMVFSFRASLDDWLNGVLGADIYLRSAAVGDSGFLDEATQARLVQLEEFRRVDFLRFDRLALDPSRPPLTLMARPVDAKLLQGFGVAPEAARSGGGDTVWISESAADLYGWKAGDRIALPLAGRRYEAVVGGVFRDYARSFGLVLMPLERYRALTGDRLASDASLYLAEGVTAARAIAAARATLPAAGMATFDDAREVHRRSLAIFDRTFAATYALEAVGILVGLAGISSSFAALAWSRRREFGMLRHLGVRLRELAAVLAIEGAAAGLIGAALGLAGGFAISLVLIHVVNRQSFHWGMELHMPWLSLAGLGAAIVALAAASALASGRVALQQQAVDAVRDDA
jgi:putative ABC transport system permease protein